MFGTDINETSEKYVVCVNLGAVKEEDLVVTFENNTLRVQATSVMMNTVATEPNIDVDIKQRSVDKSVVLGDDADGARMTHVFFAGFLEVTVPKRV